MADDLDDEWWIDQDQSTEPLAVHDAEEVHTVSAQHNRQKACKKEQISRQGKKRTSNELQTRERGRDEGSQLKKKKKKKKTLSEHLAARPNKTGTADDLRVSLATHFHGNLSAVEIEELLLEDDHFLDSNTGSESLSEYLSRVVPDWKGLLESQKEESAPKKSCLLLLLTSSARRAVDLNRDATPFKGTCVTAKLFAKHLKLEEQEKFIAKHQVDFAVGTPHRVSALIESGALTLEGTKFVILDWNWRDVKLRRLVDIPELKRDLFGLLHRHLMPACTDGGVKFGLF